MIPRENIIVGRILDGSIRCERPKHVVLQSVGERIGWRVVEVLSKIETEKERAITIFIRRSRLLEQRMWNRDIHRLDNGIHLMRPDSSDQLLLGDEINVIM